MPQNTILAAGTTAATSTDVVIAAGGTVTIGLFTSNAGGIPPQEGVTVFIDTPGNDREVVTLQGRGVPVCLSGPGTYRAVRPVSTVSFGVFTET